MESETLVRDLKNVLYVDKVYSGLAELRRRQVEGRPETIDLRLSELRIFSQNGEDGITFDLLRALDLKNGFFVEFGVGDGWSCNTRLLAEVLGWSGVYFEIDEASFHGLSERYINSSRVKTLSDAVTPENINALFDQAGVPEDLSYLCIDIDGQDYWVWKALEDRFRPALVVLEMNLAYGLLDSVGEIFQADQSILTETWGTSFRAMVDLGSAKGYTLVHIDLAGVNGFFVRDDLLALTSITGCTERSPNYGLRGKNHSLERMYGEAARTPRPTITHADPRQ